MTTRPIYEDIRYEPDERCPPLVSIGVGFQGVMLALAPTVVSVGIVFRAGGQSEAYLSWAVFSALVVCGAVTALQACRLGRLGTRHLLITGSGDIFIAVCIIALTQGGPAMMASLIVVSAVFQFSLALWLPLVRRIVTPVVSGTVFMLVALTIVPIGFDLIYDVPEDAPGFAAPIVACITLATAVGLALRASGMWRLGAPLVGIVVGCSVAAGMGLYDIQQVIEAPWIGVPLGEWTGIDLTPGPEFWALLPVFIIVSLILAISNIGDGIVVQAGSRRLLRATDFRLVQGTLNANGLGVLLGGVAGTIPPMGYAGCSTSLTSLTGVAARTVGLAIGAIFVVVAFFPKLTALLLAIPGPVAGVYLVFLMGLLFVVGLRIVMRDGMDIRSATIVGVAFSVGVGAEHQLLHPDQFTGSWRILLTSGTTVGASAAILMTLFLDLTSPRRRRLEVRLNASDLPKIDAFLRQLAARAGWNQASTERLRAAGEETLSSLLQLGDGYNPENAPRLIVIARLNERMVEMEFMAVLEEKNLEDRLAYLSQQPEVLGGEEVSFRLLRHYAYSVRHQKYHGIDIVKVEVERAR